MKIKTIIMIRGAVETLGFFSEQIAQRMRDRGMDVWFWDMEHPLKSRRQLERFFLKGKWKPYEVALWTFNFIGLSGESMFEDGEQTLWQRYGIDCYCMMVDHPLYYYKQLMEGDVGWTLVCIDTDHQKFVEKYYPDYGRVCFLPLAGTDLADLGYQEVIPYKDREIDVLFAGNYVQIPMLEQGMSGMEPENRAYYFDRIHSLIEHPDRSLEQELIGSLLFEFPEITREEVLETLYHMCVIDLYVRSYFRRGLICALAESGIKVHVIGKDWDKAECKSPENLIMVGELDSLQCLEYMRKSKISINIMPWFKNGTHDRIFNGMLQGCAVLTDSSRYLDTIMMPEKEYASFSLDAIAEVSHKIKDLLADDGKASELARNGRFFALGAHTWAHRADEILDRILK